MKYILYCRKSTEDKNKQIQSLEDQKDALLKLSKNYGLEIVKEIKESLSAKTPGLRPGFNEMIDLITKLKADGIIVYQLDRLARNNLEGGALMHYLQTGVIKEIRTIDRFTNPILPNENSLYLGVQFGMNTQFSRDLSVKVARGMMSKVEKGWYPGIAPIGYRNEKEGIQGARRILPCPNNFKTVRKLFDLMLSGQYTMFDIYNIAKNEYKLQGINPGKSKKSTPYVSKNAIYSMFRNPFYYGYFTWKGVLYKGNHQAIISKSEYDKIQEIIGNTKYEKRSLDGVPEYNGIFKCGNCDCSIYGRITKKTNKNYLYYRCSRKKEEIKCLEMPLNKSDIDNQVLDILDKFTIDQELFDFGLKILEENKPKEQNQFEDKIKTLNESLNQNQLRLQKLKNKMIDEDNQDILNGYRNAYNEIQKEIKNIEEQILFEQNRPIKEKEMIKNVINFSRTLRIKFLNGDRNIKSRILNDLGANWQISGKKIDFKPYFFMQIIAEDKRYYSKGANFGKRFTRNEKSDLKSLEERWYTQQDSNLRP